jgi:hypothetical protein
MEMPDFYLASSEGYEMEEPRKCKRLKRLCSESRGDLLLIQIEPPLIGQKYGLGRKDIDIVVIATRHKEDSLFPITEWPVFVHVARLLVDNAQEKENVRDNELETIAWAELYQTEDDARVKAM